MLLFRHFIEEFLEKIWGLFDVTVFEDVFRMDLCCLLDPFLPGLLKPG